MTRKEISNAVLGVSGLGFHKFLSSPIDRTKYAIKMLVRNTVAQNEGVLFPNTLTLRGINFAFVDWILAKIRAVRKSKGVSQQEMADLLSVDLKTYGNWENGRVDLTLRMIQRIAKALKVDETVIWDPGQFNDPTWKPNPSVKFTVNEPTEKYNTAKDDELIKTKDALIEQLQENNRLLKEKLENLQGEKKKKSKV
jgi:transcriptional regulator with XRE-family HTH domain